ncbi:MAG: peptidylprolyl isomerase [Planctomycetota bacterium]|nr:peptidylprolyl isomerase [Planctomycetota bacterium]
MTSTTTPTTPCRVYKLYLHLCVLVLSIAVALANSGFGDEGSETDLARWTKLVDEKKEIDQEITKKVDSLRAQAQQASPEERKQVIAAFEQLQKEYIQKYESLFQQMRPLAAKIDYQAAPETLTDAKNLLQASFQQNMFADAAAIAERLNASGNASADVLAMGGISLYADHRFAEAQQMLKQALQGEGVTPQVRAFVAASETYPKLWETEQAIREAEAVADNNPRVLLKTNRGDILLELFEDQAPNTVANFISLVDNGFYDGIALHRVIPRLMAQGGDPNSKYDDPRNDGSGGPPYTIACECDRPDTRMHFAGSLSMAHAGKNTGGSQFFITHLPTDHLNGKHTVFGRVLDGLPVARDLRKNDKIESASVVRKREHPYVPQTTKQ